MWRLYEPSRTDSVFHEIIPVCCRLHINILLLPNVFAKKVRVKISACFYSVWIIAYLVAFFLVLLGSRYLIVHKIFLKHSTTYCAASVMLFGVIVISDVIIYSSYLLLVDPSQQESTFVATIVMLTNFIPAALLSGFVLRWFNASANEASKKLEGCEQDGNYSR